MYKKRKPGAEKIKNGRESEKSTRKTSEELANTAVAKILYDS
jgi:hypothetical protein